jgi:hypothetical protein
MNSDQLGNQKSNEYIARTSAVNNSHGTVQQGEIEKGEQEDC